MDQFPTFDEMMTRTRFKRRVDFVKRKMDQVMKNPLFLEISSFRMPFRVERSRKVATTWRERVENPEQKVPSEPLPPVVFANGGASLGNVSSFKLHLINIRLLVDVLDEARSPYSE